VVEGTLLTAANAAYFRCLLQLLASLERHEPHRRTLVHDLGLTPPQRRTLERRHPAAELRAVDTAAWPPFMQLRPRPLNSNAWKPQLIERALEEGPILWLDAATVVLRPLDAVLRFVAATGLYTPFGGHSPIARWTHPRTAARLGARDVDLVLRMRASGVFGADPRHRAVRSLVARWAAACRDPETVAPEGALRDRHNFDQSVLNLLLADARREHGLELTRDELDISSSSPSPHFRTRNKVRNCVPLALDPVVRACFGVHRALDARILRFRRSALCPPGLRDVANFERW
jgi:hypothetical protein